jgi:RimJ/RimL family protein N-acetyltransferase
VPDPVLRTERLVLRPLTPRLSAALLSGAPTAGLRPGPGFPRDEDRTAMTGVVAAGAEAAGVWLVERDGELLGTLGVAGPVSPDGDQELGYGLVPQAWGDGLGAEAVGALCAVLERRPGVRRLTAEVLPGNAASVRLLERLGFVPVEGGCAPHVRLARPAPGQPAARQRIAGRHVC